MTEANAINAATTGIVGNTGTAFTGTPVTNHAIILGGGTSSTLTNLAPSATSGAILQSAGAAADPAFSTASYPATAGTTGKILISDGTNIVSSTPTYPNAAGTSGNLLTSDGTNIVSSAPKGLGASLVWLSSQTASNSATINFTSLISSSYTTYLLVYSAVIPVDDTSTLQMKISVDNGANYLASGYLSGTNIWLYNLATFFNDNTTTEISLNQAGNLLSAGPGVSGQLWMYNMNTTKTPSFTGSFLQNTNVNGLITSRNSTASAVNAFQMLISSGNISSGVFTLYGLRE